MAAAPLLKSPLDLSEVEAHLAADPVFGGLPAPVLHSLAAAARLEHHEAPTLLNPAGQPLRWLRQVQEGHIEIMARHASGDEVALGDIGPGGWATWVGCLSDAPPEHDFFSAADTTLLALPCAAVRAACQAHPSVYLLVISDMGVRMRQLMEWAGDSVLLGPEQRMAKLIDMLARIHKPQGQQAVLQVTQVRLARMARCSRQSANLLLGALEKRGLIVLAYGRCEIVDPQALRAFIAAEEPERVAPLPR